MSSNSIKMLECVCKEGHMAIRKARQGKKNISTNQTDTYYFDIEKCKIYPQKKVVIKTEIKVKLIQLL